MNSNEKKYKNKTSLMPKAEGSELQSLKRFNVLYWVSIWVMCTKWRAENGEKIVASPSHTSVIPSE